MSQISVDLGEVQGELDAAKTQIIEDAIKEIGIAGDNERNTLTAIVNTHIKRVQNSVETTKESAEVVADTSLPVDFRAPLKGDNFRGTARKTAKLSIGNGAVETFKDLKDLIASLPAANQMRNHIPPITVSANSRRVNEEQRNVRVRCFLYCASRGDNNDFHLVIGRSPQLQPEIYMLTRVSGLPTRNSETFSRLRAVRDSFKSHFKNNQGGLPTHLSYDFYHPPIPLDVEGSLFFNMSHARGSKSGPVSLKSRMPTIWEIHPITEIVFEPEKIDAAHAAETV
ncbi:MAG: hypothetical protein AABN34_23495 [Acidobacteriota bacterium]